MKYCTASLTFLLLLGFIILVCYKVWIKFSLLKWCPRIRKYHNKNRRFEGARDCDDEEPDEMRKALLLFSD